MYEEYWEDIVVGDREISSLDSLIALEEYPYPKSIRDLFISAATDNVKLANDTIHVNGIEVQNDFDSTPLHIAAKKNSYHVAKILIDAGADVNAVNLYEETPLELAVGNCSVDVAKLLINNPKTRINKLSEENSWFENMFIYAVSNNCVGVLDDLIKFDVDINERVCDDETPLEIAKNHNYTDVARFLVEHGAK